MWFIGVEVERETSAPPPKKNPGSALLLEEFKPSPARKMIKLLTFDNFFPPLRHSRQNS